MSTSSPPLDLERVVHDRYGAASQAREEALCCPVDYDARYLTAIPREVLERDYGCGDPSRHVQPGDTVLDLGSGGGKICFIASQRVGPDGCVIGVDLNPEMLALARGAAPEVAERVGFENVEFRRGRIQDLSLDLDRLDAWLTSRPVKSSGDLSALDAEMERLRREAPLVADESVDIVVSNCVLNLVRPDDKTRLIQEIFRVLRRGGRIAISDIVSDEPVPEDLKRDPELWSGCVSGAFEERELLGALEEAGFHGITVDQWSEEPFAVVRGIEFRSLTVTARKGKQGPCLEANDAVIYRGPWKQVEDDDGHLLRRGERSAVCAKTYRILSSPPYADQIVPIPSRVDLPDHQRGPFDCARSTHRHPRETKGEDYRVTRDAAGGCAGPSECC
jgi:ubiquinone/menaquinone biosynthesis C-methylase UbiE